MDYKKINVISNATSVLCVLTDRINLMFYYNLQDYMSEIITTTNFKAK